MPNPFADDDLVFEDGEEESTEQEQGAVAVNEEGDEFAVQDPQEQKLSRKEKKRNRYREAWETADAAKRETESLRAELAALRAQSSQQYAQPSQPQEDPTDKELKSIREEKQSLSKMWQTQATAGTLTADDQQKITDKFNELEEKQHELITMRTIRKSGLGQVNPQDQMRQIVNGRYPDVMSHPNAKAWALGELQKRKAKGESASDFSVFDDIVDQARREFRLGPYKNGTPPDEATRQRYTGNRSGMSDSGNSRPRTIKMTKEFKAMADTLFSHIPEEKDRWKAWAKEVGPGLLEELSKNS